MKQALLASTLVSSMVLTACGGGDSVGVSNTSTGLVYEHQNLNAGDFYNEVNNGSVDLGQGANPFKHPDPPHITVNMPSSVLLDLAAHSLEVFNMGQQPQRMLIGGRDIGSEVDLAKELFNSSGYGLQAEMFDVFSLSQLCQYDAQYDNRFYLEVDNEKGNNRDSQIRVQYKADQCVVSDVYPVEVQDQLLISGDINFSIFHNTQPTGIHIWGSWFIGDTSNNQSESMHYRAYRNLSLNVKGQNSNNSVMLYTNLKADMYLRDNHFFYDHLYFVNSKNISAYYGADTPFAGQLSIENEKNGVITLVFSQSSLDIIVNGAAVLEGVSYQRLLDRDLHR